MTSQPRPEDVRLVSMTREQCSAVMLALTEILHNGTITRDRESTVRRLRSIIDAWDAAPADAAEAVRNKLIALREGERGPSVREVGWKPTLPDFELELIADDTRAVLLALGYPHTEHADPAPPTENT